MQPKRVVVTGSAGRLGAGICRRLEQEGRLVAGVDRVPGPFTEVVDLTRPSARLREILSTADALVHAAALPGPSITPPPRVDPELGRRLVDAGIIGLESASALEVATANFASTFATFEAACAAPNMRRVVFSSSAFLMGWSHDSSIVPTMKGPYESYGLSKEAGEATARMLARATGVEFCALRFTNMVKRELYHTLPWTYDAAIPRVMWAWCAEDDVVDAHVRAVDSQSLELDENFEALLIAAPSSRFQDKDPIFDCRRAQVALEGWNPRCWTRGSEAAKRARTDPELRRFDLGGFELESGAMPEGAQLCYTVRGEGPVILHPTSYGAVHSDLEYNIGPGKTLDTDQYTVVVCNLLGNGVSCSPSNEPRYPPVVTVRDNVRMQRAMLSHEGLLPLTCVYGYSMGAMQAFEWARSFPDDVASIVAVCGASGCATYNAVFLKALATVLETEMAREAKLRIFATIYAGWGVGYDFYEGRDPDAFIESSYIPGFADDDPDDLLAMVRTWRSTPLFDETDLRNFRTRCLIMPCDNDTYFRVDEIKSREAAFIPNVTFAPLMSPYGHRAGDPWRPGMEAEADHVRSHVHDFLSKP